MEVLPARARNLLRPRSAPWPLLRGRSCNLSPRGVYHRQGDPIMTDKPSRKPRQPDAPEKKLEIEELELNAETVRELTARAAERVRGGFQALGTQVVTCIRPCLPA